MRLPAAGLAEVPAVAVKAPKSRVLSKRASVETFRLGAAPLASLLEDLSAVVPHNRYTPDAA